MSVRFRQVLKPVPLASGILKLAHICPPPQCSFHRFQKPHAGPSEHIRTAGSQSRLPTSQHSVREFGVFPRIVCVRVLPRGVCSIQCGPCAILRDLFLTLMCTVTGLLVKRLAHLVQKASFFTLLREGIWEAHLQLPTNLCQQQLVTSGILHQKDTNHNHQQE